MCAWDLARNVYAMPAFGRGVPVFSTGAAIVRTPTGSDPHRRPAVTSYDRGAASLDELCLGIESVRDQDKNEATTRLQVIDKLLMDVLGWPSDQVNCEEYHEGGFLDYVVGDPQSHLVLEAKKVGLHFEVPAGTDSGTLSLRQFIEHSSTNEKAVEQVLEYCQHAGIPIAVLCNGDQIVAFLGSRADGVAPKDGDAVIYKSLVDARAQFAALWDQLSMHGVESGALARQLSSNQTLAVPPPPLSASIHQYPGYRIGSAMETDLSILGDLFIQDVVNDDSVTEDFLTHCYCSSGALSQFASVSKEILRSRYASLGKQVQVSDARDKKGPNQELQKSLVPGSLTTRPIVLLGDVGVGKSIFLKHLFRLDAKDVLENTVVFHIDFLNHSGLNADVSAHIVEAIRREFEGSRSVDISEDKLVRAVYNAEINRFKKGVNGPLEVDDPVEFRHREIDMLEAHLSAQMEHVRRTMEFLRASRGLNFVVALDNVDQHEIEFQDRLFIVAHSLAAEWPATVFLALRPDTFHQSRRSGALAAYQPRVFTVSPPRSDQVIVKRLKFAAERLKADGRLPGFPAGLTLDSTTLLVYISVLTKAFTDNQKLISVVDNLSSGNTRRALDFISTFVGSGYVQTSRILELAAAGDTYVVPPHEFLRAILFQDHKYYDPESSPVPNLLWISTRSSQEHFLLPILLGSVQHLGKGEQNGFVSKSRIFASTQPLGFSPTDIDIHFQRAIEADLVEVSDVDDPQALARVTPAGAYMHQSLISDFAYLDAIVVDTPILDPKYRSRIRDVQPIENRVERVEAFIEYLDESWPFGDEPMAFSWPRAREAALTEVERVKNGAKRASTRRSQTGNW